MRVHLELKRQGYKAAKYGVAVGDRLYGMDYLGNKVTIEL